MRPVIALLTDFGTTDIYVGVMKGVIAQIAPDANVIDLTHGIAAQDVRMGALALMNSVRYFPSGTIFVAVVDPGVGSERAPIIIKAGGYTFVAPDNGLLSYCLRELALDEPPATPDNRAYHLPIVSSTFHGRDLFAPVAAHLATGVPLDEIGSPVDGYTQLPLPLLTESEDTITGEVLSIDHFGNVITSIGRLRWLDADHIRLDPIFSVDLPTRISLARRCRITVGTPDGGAHAPIARTFADTPPGANLALIGSAGFLELSINLGNFADTYTIRPGDRVNLQAG